MQGELQIIIMIIVIIIIGIIYQTCLFDHRRLASSSTPSSSSSSSPLPVGEYFQPVMTFSLRLPLFPFSPRYFMMFILLHSLSLALFVKGFVRMTRSLFALGQQASTDIEMYNMDVSVWTLGQIIPVPSTNLQLPIYFSLGSSGATIYQQINLKRHF